MEEKNKTITSTDPKVLEFLEYLGVELRLTKSVIINIPLNGVVTLEIVRMAEKKDIQK